MRRWSNVRQRQPPAAETLTRAFPQSSGRSRVAYIASHRSHPVVVLLESATGMQRWRRVPPSFLGFPITVLV